MTKKVNSSIGEIRENYMVDPISSSENTIDNQVVVQTTQIRSGPLPSPETLAGYENVVPGAAERIIQMAERSQKHIEDMEKQTLDLNREAFIKGRLFGFCALIILVGAALYAASMGYMALSMAFIGTAALGVVVQFIQGKDRDVD